MVPVAMNGAFGLRSSHTTTRTVTHTLVSHSFAFRSRVPRPPSPPVAPRVPKSSFQIQPTARVRSPSSSFAPLSSSSSSSHLNATVAHLFARFTAVIVLHRARARTHGHTDVCRAFDRPRVAPGSRRRRLEGRRSRGSTDRSIDRSIGVAGRGSIDRSIDRSGSGSGVFRSVDRSFALSIGLSVFRSFDRSFGLSIGLSIGLSVDRSVFRSFDRSVGRSIDRSIGCTTASGARGRRGINQLIIDTRFTPSSMYRYTLQWTNETQEVVRPTQRQRRHRDVERSNHRIESLVTSRRPYVPWAWRRAACARAIARVMSPRRPRSRTPRAWTRRARSPRRWR